MPSAVVAGIEAEPLSPPPARYSIPNVPFFNVKASRYGPASVASVLSFWGQSVSAEDLAAQSPAGGTDGSPRSDMEQAARARGLAVWAYRGGLADLRNHVSLGHPVIAYLDTGSPEKPDGEFIVVTGYNDKDRKISAHSVEQPERSVGYDQFVEAWAKADFWTLVILPKESRRPDDFMENQPR